MTTGLFIDIGYATTGWVKLEITKEGYGSMIDNGCLVTKKSTNKNMRYAVDSVRRCAEIFNWIICQGDVNFIAVELPHGGGKSAQAVRSLAYCIAIAACAESHMYKVPFVYVAPEAVKYALCNSKTAKKDQMMKAAKDLYPKNNFPKAKNKMEHIADAIGVSEAVKFDNYLKIIREQL